MLGELRGKDGYCEVYDRRGVSGWDVDGGLFGDDGLLRRRGWKVDVTAEYMMKFTEVEVVGPHCDVALRHSRCDCSTSLLDCSGSDVVYQSLGRLVRRLGHTWPGPLMPSGW